ncbi:CalX-like domain-containing protein [Desulfonema limicola]|uniref:CalX-like domain-containing protein n=2 Tax=Desulfonema limicola TaxID=45656 RepID=A0A975BD56_9BACT|nr:CalX-like domain-containing protein [Desulfonema limicola]
MLESEIKILRDIWGSSGSDVFAVGDRGLIMHFDGIEWKQMASSTEKNLEGIWGSSGSDVFAAGSNGTILHYNGISWRQMDARTQNDLTKIWGSSGANVFVSGDKGTILHYDGTGWVPMITNNNKNIYNLWGISDADVFAVGGNGAILHYNGSQWFPMDSGTAMNIFSIWGTTGSDILAAGINTLLHYNGRNWIKASDRLLHFRCMWGSSGSGIYIGGTDPDNNDTGFIYQYNNLELSKININPAIPVYGLWGSSNSEIFAVGGNQDTGGTILYFDGKNWNPAWQQSDKGFTKKLESLWGTSENNVFAVGEQGTVMHYDGKNWSFLNSGTKESLRGIWGYDENNIFTAGDQGTILNFDGKKWVSMPGNTNRDLYQVWGYQENPGSKPELFTAGENGIILYHDGNEWSSMDSKTTRTLRNIWGYSGTDVYAAGDGGTILHYNGNQWSSLNSGIKKNIRGLWGSSGNNVYAAGDSELGGTTAVLKYNGLQWKALSADELFLTTQDYFLTIWGRSFDNVFLAGFNNINLTENNAVIRHFNGKTWNTMSINADSIISSIWGVPLDTSPVTEVFGVLSDGSIAHYWAIGISLPENINEQDGKLEAQGIVSIKNPLEKDLKISLFSDDTSEIIVPETVIIPAGQTSADFDIIVKDDDFPDGTRQVLITASAPGFNPGTRIVYVNDNESLELQISVPLNINESDGLISGRGKVLIPAALEDEVYVSLSSDNPHMLKVPPEVKIPAGVNQAVFDIMAVDDTEIDGIQTVLVTGAVKGWVPASSGIEIFDDDKYGLTLVLPETAKENDEILQDAGIVSIPAAFPLDIIISLSSDDTSEIKVPDNVKIPAGATSAAFDLFPLHDLFLDGTQSAAITASSPEFISAVAVIDIQDSDFQWDIMEKGTSNLRCLWGSSKQDIFSAGWNGVIMHYDGKKWQHMETNTDAHFRSIWGSSPDNVFAVGNDGAVLHYNGKEWTMMDSGTDMVLYDIWGSSGTNVFAVGGSSATGGIIIHYDGKKWTVVKNDLKDYLRSIWGVSADNIIAVGEKGQILHYNGIKWDFMDSSNKTTLKGIWGSSENNYFAVGSDLILHYNGIEWKTVESGKDKNLIEIWGRSKDDIYAVGYSGMILHYDGTAWHEMESGTQDSLWGIWGAHDFGVFISGVDGLILKNNGTQWEISKETDTYYKGVWCVPQEAGTVTRAYAVGDKGTIVFYDGTSWNQQESGYYPNLNSIWGRSDSEIFAVGDEGIILRFDGFSWRKTDSGVYDNLNDVSGLSSEYGLDVFAVGDNGIILHFDGALWHQMESPTDKKLGGVWAASDESGQYNIIAAGDDGLIFHYNGKQWQQMETKTERYIYDVWGASLSDIYAVGPGGTILYYNGNHWQNIDMVNNTLTGVWGRSASDVYISGYSGTILHYNGIKWINMNTISRSLHSICGNGGLDIFAAGRDNTIVHYRAAGIKIPGFAEEGQGGSALQGRVFLDQIQEKDIAVGLTSHDISEITVPESIIIPAGQDSGFFDLNIEDDDLYDGIQQAAITASVPGFSLGTGFIDIIDNEIAEISIELPGNINEGDGSVPGKGIITMNEPAGKDVSISLISESPAHIMVPKQVVIPKGESSALFDFTVIDDKIFNNTRTVFITGSVKGWNTAGSSLDIYDNEVKALELDIPLEASENDRTVKAGISIPGILSSDIIVELSSDNTGEVIVPGTITIPAGKMDMDFDLNIIDDPDIDGLQTAVITASAPGWSPAQSSIEISDNDPGELEFSSSIYTAWENIPGAKISVTRKDSYSSTITIDYKTAESDDINSAVSNQDYIPVSGTLIFEPGETQKSFSIPILQDNKIEGGESINLVLENPSEKVSLGENNTAKLIITDKMIWEKQDLSTPFNIKSLWGDSCSNIFAAGWQGTILRFNGKTWENMNLNTGSTVLFEGIWGSSGSDVYAAGSKGIILYFDGTIWKSMKTGITSNLYCIWGIENNIYAGGSGVILRYSGTVWEKMNADIDKFPDIRAIWGTSGSDIFAAGSDGIILHYNGGNAWHKMESNTDAHLYDIWGSSGSDVFAAGSFGLVMHYDGSTWKKMKTGIDNILF